MAFVPPQHLRFQRTPELVRTAASSAAGDTWAQWDALAERLAAPPFLRPGWVDAWHRSYGTGELELLTVGHGPELAGILPVELHGRTTLSPTNTHTPLFGPLATTPDVERSLAVRLASETAGRVELAYLDPAASWPDTLTAALGPARRTTAETLTRPPYVATRGSFDDHLAGLSRRFVKELRRCRRRLAEQGRLEVAFHTTLDGLDRALDEFVALESSGWKADEGTAIASRDASREFYASIARWAAGRGWLRLAFMRLDGRPIAAELDLECAGAMYALKSGYDREFAGFGPGQLLTGDCLAEAFAAGLDSYEFLGTDEGYKMSWTATTRERVRVQSFPRTPRGRLEELGRRRLRPAVRGLRRRGQRRGRAAG